MKRKSASTICLAARKARMPTTIKPMLATLVDEPFSDPEWIFETKWDGFRSVCFIKNGKARFVSRNQIEMTPQYPELCDVPEQIGAKEAILDGELVALDKDGMPRFQLLQNKLRIRSGSYAHASKAQIVYFAFDLLYVDGFDLMNCPVVERKAKLAEILRPTNFIKQSEHIKADGEEFFRHIEKFQLEGMIAKRAASKYVQKRTTDWLKVKTVMRIGSCDWRIHSASRRALSFWIACLWSIPRRRSSLRSSRRRWIQRTLARIDLQIDAAAEDRQEPLPPWLSQREQVHSVLGASIGRSSCRSSAAASICKSMRASVR